MGDYDKEMKEKMNSPLESQQDDVLLYILGDLSEAEETAFEQRVVSGPPGSFLEREVAEQMESLAVTAERIAASMPAPRRGLKDRILTAIGPTPKQHIVRSGEDGWAPSGFEGIDMKVLYEDKTRGIYSVMARFGPGVHHQKHRHVGVEECFVLQGDLHMNEINLKAGDFIVTHDSSIHDDTWSDHGCILLLSTQLKDEMLTN